MTTMAMGCDIIEPSTEKDSSWPDQRSASLSTEPDPAPLTAGCWSFVFGKTSEYFPNPIHFGRIPEMLKILKIRLNLLVLDTDFALRSAMLNVDVTNTLGQQVAAFSLGSFSSAPDFEVAVWQGGITGVAAGFYIVKVTAVSDICGQKSISGNIIAN